MSSSPVRRIVWVEDSEDEVFLAHRILRRGRLAIDLVHYPAFDTLARELEGGTVFDERDTIVVLDLNLKLCSGIDVLRDLRGRPATRNLIAGFCTGSEDPADRREAREAGADFYVAKPLLLTGVEAICRALDGLHWAPESDDACPLRRLPDLAKAS